ncbi:MAG TPA: hydroxyacylglutathione hydrolase [Brevundimonas sp.]|jgi:hydroxyacylglutathione hydrolase|uniref:hydroxyacylglutathione hydrolase n=1 Tax=Brevundimonas sp. TaxID=1871086 RepID=UPI002DED3AF4|nr:hydroxyacylglutathione hydrolase [Brevundimonas sp.]
MTLDVRLFPCLSDNYGFLVRDRATGEVAAVDAPDAAAILSDLETSGWGRLDLLLNTHWHPDHTQGNAAVKAATGCEIVGPEEVRRVAPLDRAVAGGDRVRLGQTSFEVLDMPGHTLGHVVFLARDAGEAFVGDVIFPLGCGRLFEGTPAQMWTSLSTVADWDGATRLWGAHEYALSNARFALSVDDRPELAAHVAELTALRERGAATVPTTVETERRFNPFLTAGDGETFAARRAAKDVFAG